MSVADWIKLRRLQKIWRNPPLIPVRVDGHIEYVTESARRTAALNMAEDPLLRARIVAMIGEVEARRRYPESFLD